jgi:hypothetical protein
VLYSRESYLWLTWCGDCCCGRIFWPTEAIVDFGLAFNKPFACVPCCVYSKEFPNRRFADGTLVKSYEQLCSYLIAKAPDKIQVAKLPFNGKNTVLYYMGYEHTQQPPPQPQETHSERHFVQHE